MESPKRDGQGHAASTGQKDERLRNFVFHDLRDLATRTLDYQKDREGKDRDRILEARGGIADFSRSYLGRIESGLPEGMAGKISEQIDALRELGPEETIILMSAHQPNLFAYSGILRKIALLKALEAHLAKGGTKKRIICFYGIADHDFVNNKWVRSAEMPAPLRKDGVLRFNIDLDKKELFLPTNRIAKPSDEKLAAWRAQVEGWIREDCSLAIKYAKAANLESAQRNIQELAKNNFENYWKRVEEAQRSSTNLADFSSFLLATIVNNIFETPVVFANFSDCLPIFGKEYGFLLSRVDEYSDTIRKDEKALEELSMHSGLSEDVGDLLPVWVRCECGSKYRMAASSSTPVKFTGKCVRCEREVEYTKEGLMALLDSSPRLFEPRSISIPLTFARAFDMSCYVGGKGGLGYLMHAKAVSERLGMRMPPTPYWHVPDEFVGIETLAAAWEAQRIADAYGLTMPERSHIAVANSAQAASEQMNQRMREGAIPKAAVSERERQLLERIPKSLKTPACAIDYAINIGIDSTYRQWVDFLVKGGGLQDPTKLKSIIS